MRLMRVPECPRLTESTVRDVVARSYHWRAACIPNDYAASSANMSTSTQSSAATDVDSNGDNELPKIEALFLIRFDKKVG
jgi:hypothetical protein